MLELVDLILEWDVHPQPQQALLFEEIAIIFRDLRLDISQLLAVQKPKSHGPQDSPEFVGLDFADFELPLGLLGLLLEEVLLEEPEEVTFELLDSEFAGFYFLLLIYLVDENSLSELAEASPLQEEIMM